MNTFYRASDLDGEDDSPFDFVLLDKLNLSPSKDESSLNLPADHKFNLVRVYLSNVRTIAVILNLVLFSWLKKLVQTRVVYDRELFNFEEYASKCLSDNRLINRTLLATTTNLPNKTPPGKHLMGEFFKFLG